MDYFSSIEHVVSKLYELVENVFLIIQSSVYCLVYMTFYHEKLNNTVICVSVAIHFLSTQCNR